MINCPQCSYQNSDNASFCSRCGASLANASPTNPAVESMEPTVVVAPQPPPTSAATPTPTSAPTPGHLPTTEPSRGTNWPLVAGIAGACFIVCTGIIALALSRPQTAVAPETKLTKADESGELELGESHPDEAAKAIAAAEATAESALPKPPIRDQPDVTAVNADVWQVVDTEGLNCRQGAGSKTGVRQVLRPGKEVLVNGSYANPLVYDNNGDPWLAVVVPGTNCFVRANAAYIKALPDKAQPTGTQFPQGTCPPTAVVLKHLESPNFNLFICGNPGNDAPTHYSGFAKNGSGGITVPLSGVDEGGYYARNGDVLYHIDPNEMMLNVEVPDQNTVSEPLSWVN